MGRASRRRAVNKSSKRVMADYGEAVWKDIEEVLPAHFKALPGGVNMDKLVGVAIQGELKARPESLVVEWAAQIASSCKPDDPKLGQLASARAAIAGRKTGEYPVLLYPLVGGPQVRMFRWTAAAK